MTHNVSNGQMLETKSPFHLERKQRRHHIHNTLTVREISNGIYVALYIANICNSAALAHLHLSHVGSRSICISDNLTNKDRVQPQTPLPSVKGMLKTYISSYTDFFLPNWIWDVSSFLFNLKILHW